MNPSGIQVQAIEALAHARWLLEHEDVTAAELGECLAKLLLVRRDLDALIEELRPEGEKEPWP